MPTMLQMGYAGEAPGMGFGDDAENVKTEVKTEKYLKNILNGRLKSGSAYEIDWENEPLPKDIFTDKNKDQKAKDINKSRDCMFNPNLEQQEETEYRGVHDLTVR